MKAIDLEVKRICEEKLANDAKLSELFKNCYPNTMDTTVKTIGEKDTFVITGDIPAMWLRDSTAQVRHYLPVAKHDAEVADCIEGLVNRQFKCIDIDLRKRVQSGSERYVLAEVRCGNARSDRRRRVRRYRFRDPVGLGAQV